MDDPTNLNAATAADPAGEARLLERRSQKTETQARSILSKPVADHLMDAILVLALVSVVYALGRKGLQPPPPASGSVVAAERDIPAFYVIAKDDVALKPAGTVPTAAITAVSDAIGRYPLRTLLKGRPVERSALSQGYALGNELKTLQIARISLQFDKVMSTITPPIDISLAAASATNSVFVSNVWILDLEIQGEGASATIATSDQNMQKLTPFLSGGRITPVWPAPSR